MSILRRAGLALCLVACWPFPPSPRRSPVRRFVLSNGLTVLFLPRPQAPVFTG